MSARIRIRVRMAYIYIYIYIYIDTRISAQICSVCMSHETFVPQLKRLRIRVEFARKLVLSVLILCLQILNGLPLDAPTP